jgi:hypothetical protein
VLAVYLWNLDEIDAFAKQLEISRKGCKQVLIGAQSVSPGFAYL